MTPVELLAEASRLGIHLEIDGAEVRYRAPVGVLIPELKDAFRAHKGELLKLITASPADFHSEDPCPVCGSHEGWYWFDERTLCRGCTVLDLLPLTLVRQGSDRPTERHLSSGRGEESR